MTGKSESKSKAKPSKKPAVPSILPREPLTRKAERAITAYALDRCKGATMYPLLIKFVLQAERMRREDLYAWLEKHGYKWEPAAGSWRKAELVSKPKTS